MMKMLIKLNEDKVKQDNIYNIDTMWKVIDNQFKEACTKEKQEDGAVIYSSIADKDYFTCIGVAYIRLRHQEWFAKYCTKWIWYDNDSDETLPFQEINVLAEEQEDNDLFM